jgi:hypothetical protein
VAHLVIYLDLAGSFFDLVAPLENISDEYLSLFTTEWGAEECAGGHALKFELSVYSSLLASSTPVNVAWEAATGLTSPLFIMAGISVTDLSKVDDIFTMVGSINNITETTAVFGETSSSAESQCSYRELTVDAIYGSEDVDITSTAIRYILHNSTNQGVTGYTLTDWEDLHEEIYAMQMTQSLTGEKTWSRYLDSHIGIEAPFSESCATSLSLISDMYDAAEDEYIVEKRTNLHFYTGVSGIMAWEFNARQCKAQDDTCGCIASNSYDAYYAMYGTNCW